MEKFGQSLALSKNLLIAVRRLSGDGLALSVSLRSPALPLGATATTAASGGNSTFRAGDTVMEMIGTVHYGENRGDEPAEVIMFYAGTEGLPLKEEAE